MERKLLIILITFFYGQNNSYLFSMKPLHRAARDGDCEKIKDLIEIKKVDINEPDDLGRTALHFALYDCHFNAITLLLRHGANPDARNIINGETALHMAAKKGKNNIILLLSTYGADIHALNKDDETPLHCIPMWQEKSISTVKLFKQLGATIDQKMRNLLPSYFAHHWISQEIFDYLNALQALPSETSEKLNNELLCIPEAAHSIQGDKESEEYKQKSMALLQKAENLLDQGAQINTKNKADGNTALYYAVAWRLNHVAKFFIKRGAPINAQNNKEETSLLKAIKNNDRPMASLLIRSGADSSLEDSSGHSPLTFALHNDSWKSVFGLGEPQEVY